MKTSEIERKRERKRERERERGREGRKERKSRPIFRLRQLHYLFTLEV